MYLKSIKASGFKSFADKVSFELDQGITGIVGPNGSGKSNVVDAIRWVLGEQSIKSLRGEGSMTDIIFNGSKSRDAASRASVSLTFDNNDHYLNSEFNEIEIKRIVYNTGENEYLLNNVKVRLKDITDLFLDSGVDKEAFNIISQGEVANIVNSKPHERRTIFESAASVLKYKKRKEESLRKLDKTKENLTRINLLITELETTVLPLKEQAIKAKKYNDLKDKLASIEIALSASDITNLNNQIEQIKLHIVKLNRDLESINQSSGEDIAKNETLKLERLKIEQQISNTNESLLKISDEIALLDSEKRLNIERKKYETGDSVVNIIYSLKEEVKTLEKNRDGLIYDINSLANNLSDANNKKDILNEELNGLNIKRNLELDKLNNITAQYNSLENQISIAKENVTGDNLLPYPVKGILNNPRLKTHGILGKLMQFDEMYATALETVIGYNYNVVVVDSENEAKDCINYLKEQQLGRVTFFPISLIKKKIIDPSTMDRIKSINGVIGIANDLVKCDSLYQNIIDNQLGNVIVVKDIDTLNMVGRIIDHTYRIVSLDGEISHAGGSITGGSNKFNKSAFQERIRLNEMEKSILIVKDKIDHAKENINTFDQDITLLTNQINSILEKIYYYDEQIKNKQQLLSDYEYSLKNKESELAGYVNVSDNALDQKIDELLSKYYLKVTEKEKIVKELESYKNNLFEITNTIASFENNERNQNAAYNHLLNELKTQEISLTKAEMQLDNLLTNLSEDYNITYEYALKNYELMEEIDIARKEVHHLKLEIRDLGEVNTGSILEYERLSVRYDFLKKQAEDLEKASEELLNIISEMDDIMKDKFLQAFNQIKVEFSKVFKQLFKGGEGTLKLTDPDNLLETGIEILAVPPGKKISSNTLLSGGEKTLTAIALLFAILNVKKAPFCILDEVEAALDEANVDMFGNFLRAKKDASQFIIITHKKRTMEYADYLYGITMQESGVSKLVSVKLENMY